MSKILESKNTDELMAEADELIQQINSDAIKDMQEEHRLQFDAYAKRLQKIKSEVPGKTEGKEKLERDSGADGIHEAILDIVKAMHDFKKKLF